MIKLSASLIGFFAVILVFTSGSLYSSDLSHSLPLGQVFSIIPDQLKIEGNFPGTKQREYLFVDAILGGHPPAGHPIKRFFLLRKGKMSGSIDFVVFSADGKGVYWSIRDIRLRDDMVSLNFVVKRFGRGDGASYKSTAIVSLGYNSRHNEGTAIIMEIKYHRKVNSIQSLFIAPYEEDWEANGYFRPEAVAPALLSKALNIANLEGGSGSD